MKKEIISALPIIYKQSGRTKGMIIEENNHLANINLENFLQDNPYIRLYFITEIRPKDENLIGQFEKINKKYTTCCPIENFVYPYIEVFSKSFHNTIPFDTQPKNILEAYNEIRKILSDYKTEYENGRKRAKLKYKILMRIPETYKFGKIKSI